MSHVWLKITWIMHCRLVEMLTFHDAERFCRVIHWKQVVRLVRLAFCTLFWCYDIVTDITIPDRCWTGIFSHSKICGTRGWKENYGSLKHVACWWHVLKLGGCFLSRDSEWMNEISRCLCTADGMVLTYWFNSSWRLFKCVAISLSIHCWWPYRRCSGCSNLRTTEYWH